MSLEPNTEQTNALTYALELRRSESDWNKAWWLTTVIALGLLFVGSYAASLVCAFCAFAMSVQGRRAARRRRRLVRDWRERSEDFANVLDRV